MTFQYKPMLTITMDTSCIICTNLLQRWWCGSKVLPLTGAADRPLPSCHWLGPSYRCQWCDVQSVCDVGHISLDISHCRAPPCCQRAMSADSDWLPSSGMLWCCSVVAAASALQHQVNSTDSCTMPWITLSCESQYAVNHNMLWITLCCKSQCLLFVQQKEGNFSETKMLLNLGIFSWIKSWRQVTNYLTRWSKSTNKTPDKPSTKTLASSAWSKYFGSISGFSVGSVFLSLTVPELFGCNKALVM